MQVYQLAKYRLSAISLPTNSPPPPPISDREIIAQQHEKRLLNHPFSSSSKHNSKKILQTDQLVVGDLVYLYADRDKTRARSRYLVVSIDGEWCFIKKFVGTQLRSSSYKVKTSECYRVPNEKAWSVPLKYLESSDSEDEVDNVLTRQNPPFPVNIPTILSQPAEPSMPVYSTVVSSPLTIATLIHRTYRKFLF